MNKIKCVLAYDGSGFSGFQIQPKKRTVQGEIEKALTKIHKGQQIRIYPSGRTDTGVHAIGQVFHFESELMLDQAAWKRALSAILPADIYIKETTIADSSFHARFDATEKEYRYFVLNREEPDIFKRNYVYHSSAVYNMDVIREACELFLGTHDFTSFSSARSTVKGSKVRTIYKLDCAKQGEMIQFTIRGSGFLQHMVRIIVGAILEAGQGERSIEELAMILQQKDRTMAGVTIPPQGLYLWEVAYHCS